MTDSQAFLNTFQNTLTYYRQLFHTELVYIYYCVKSPFKLNGSEYSRHYRTIYLPFRSVYFHQYVLPETAFFHWFDGHGAGIVHVRLYDW